MKERKESKEKEKKKKNTEFESLWKIFKYISTNNKTFINIKIILTVLNFSVKARK